MFKTLSVRFKLDEFLHDKLVTGLSNLKTLRVEPVVDEVEVVLNLIVLLDAEAEEDLMRVWVEI